MVACIWCVLYGSDIMKSETQSVTNRCVLCLLLRDRFLRHASFYYTCSVQDVCWIYAGDKIGPVLCSWLDCRLIMTCIVCAASSCSLQSVQHHIATPGDVTSSMFPGERVRSALEQEARPGNTMCPLYTNVKCPPWPYSIPLSALCFCLRRSTRIVVMCSPSMYSTVTSAAPLHEDLRGSAISP